ncbi:hypothetical protein BsWGS_25234 [Bradybaena similaris]
MTSWISSKLKPSEMKKSNQPEQALSKEEIIHAMENYSLDRSQGNKENNNNAKPLSRGSSLDNKWEFVDSDPLSAPASLSHSYSTEWENLFNRPDMMKKLKERALEGNLRSSRFRSVIWKLFLEVLPSQTSSWIDKTKKSRNKFEELKNRLIVNPRKAVDSVDISLNNPLSQDEESPWNKFFQDNELRLTIKQDVIRTFPEVEFFRAPEMNELMIEILFCFCREHASNSYKQGMHELLAPLIFILHCDHQAFLHACEIESVLYCSEEARTVMKEIMDPAYLEHDAYTMFCQVMETVEPWYLSRDMFYSHSKSGSIRNLEMINATPFSKSQDLNPSSAIVTKLTRIQDYILKKFDPELHQHLERLEIVPQIYGIRWLRLLFGREFPMQDLLMLWDAIFGDGIGFDLVDYIFVAMLMYIRDVLLTSDYATCLTVLMKYPPVPDVHYFVLKAMWIREPNQHPRPPNYTHQGSIKGSSSISSTENISGASIGALVGSRDTSRDMVNSPIGSTVSLSHVEESMFRHTPSASSLARMESSNLRSAQSSPGLRQTSLFPLTPDDVSITSSPTKNNTLPGKTKGKQKKLTKLEKEMQEQISHLQGELNDKASMCRYCSCKLDVHIGRLQQDLSRQNIEVDDDIMISLAGLKLVRDILNGTLKFTLTFAAEDDEIQMNDDYYGNHNGGANSTGITSPDSDILLGVTSSGEDELKQDKQRYKLFYMSSEEANSPDSISAGPLAASFSSGLKGSDNVNFNYYSEGNAPTFSESVKTGERKLSLQKDATFSGDDTKDSSSSFQIASKIKRVFQPESSSNVQSKQTQLQQSKGTNSREPAGAVCAFKASDADWCDISHIHSENPDETSTQAISVYSKQAHVETAQASIDTRCRAKSNVESTFHWPGFSPSPPQPRLSKGSQLGYPDKQGHGEKSVSKQTDEQKVRERSKSQPSAFSSGAYYHSLYHTNVDKERKMDKM